MTLNVYIIFLFLWFYGKHVIFSNVISHFYFIWTNVCSNKSPIPIAGWHTLFACPCTSPAILRWTWCAWPGTWGEWGPAVQPTETIIKRRLSSSIVLLTSTLLSCLVLVACLGRVKWWPGWRTATGYRWPPSGAGGSGSSWRYLGRLWLPWALTKYWGCRWPGGSTGWN